MSSPANPDSGAQPPDPANTPDIWPVQLVALLFACTGAASLGLFVVDLHLGHGLQLWPAVLPVSPVPPILAAYAILTTWGLLHLRAWGWWCAVVLLTFATVAVYVFQIRGVPLRDSLAGLTVEVTALFALLYLLARSRRLFFRPPSKSPDPLK